MVLGRKLHAAFERKAGKIEWLNPGISDSLQESALYFQCQPDKDGDGGVWAVHRGSRADFIARDQASTALKKSRHFLELRSEEHTSELQSRGHLVCRLLLEKKKRNDRMSIRMNQHKKQETNANGL